MPKGLKRHMTSKNIRDRDVHTLFEEQDNENRRQKFEMAKKHTIAKKELEMVSDINILAEEDSISEILLGKDENTINH